MNATHSSGAQPNTAGKAAWILLAIAWICFLLPLPGSGVFIGWPVNLVAFILAIVAMSKGGTRKGLIQLLLSLVASPVIYFIGTMLFVGAVGAAADQSAKSAAAGKAASKEVAMEQADTVPVERIAVTATELYNDYKANEIAANARYKGKPLLITGTVSAIQSDLLDKPLIQLAAGDFVTVTISGLSVEEASELSKGSRIKAACIGNGELLTFPATRDCTLQD
ncbi:MAG: OB-fold protein [Pseudomonas sp.]